MRSGKGGEAEPERDKEGMIRGVPSGWKKTTLRGPRQLSVSIFVDWAGKSCPTSWPGIYLYESRFCVHLVGAFHRTIYAPCFQSRR